MLLVLLSEREPHESISHRELPSIGAHYAFVMSRPYKVWCAIYVDDMIVGACYLTLRDEIGIGIFKAARGKGYGKRAVQMLMNSCGERRYLANINPQNERSLGMFDSIGFKPLQVTLAIDYKYPDIGPQ